MRVCANPRSFAVPPASRTTGPRRRRVSGWPSRATPGGRRPAAWSSSRLDIVDVTVQLFQLVFHASPLRSWPAHPGPLVAAGYAEDADARQPQTAQKTGHSSTGMELKSTLKRGQTTQTLSVNSRRAVGRGIRRSARGASLTVRTKICGVCAFCGCNCLCVLWLWCLCVLWLLTTGRVNLQCQQAVVQWVGEYGVALDAPR